LRLTASRYLESIRRRIDLQNWTLAIQDVCAF
jgi:hypothetical protein